MEFTSHFSSEIPCCANAVVCTSHTGQELVGRLVGRAGSSLLGGYSAIGSEVSTETTCLVFIAFEVGQ